MLVLSRKTKERIVIRVNARLRGQVRAILDGPHSDGEKVRLVREVLDADVPEVVEVGVVRVFGSGARLGVQADKEHVHIVRAELETRDAA